MQSITPPLIAVIGSDGSGKSTVCEHLITVVEKYGAAERVHLGKQAGNVGRAVTKLPLMGKAPPKVNCGVMAIFLASDSLLWSGLRAQATSRSTLSLMTRSGLWLAIQ